MRVTTKPITREIKENQKIMAAQLEGLALTQESNYSKISEQISNLQERTSNLKICLSELQQEQEKQNAEILDCIKNLLEIMTKQESAIVEKTDESTNQIIDRLEEISNEGIKSIVMNSNQHFEREEQLIEKSILQVKESVINEVRQIRASEEEISTSIEVLCQKHEIITDQICNTEEKVCSNTNLAREVLYKELDKIDAALRDASITSESHDEIFTENIETMNIAMQEIARNISSLDEGNRLIIAKLLLKDLGE